MPDGMSAGASGKQTFQHDINVTLQNQDGTPAAPPIAISKTVGPAQPTAAN